LEYYPDDSELINNLKKGDVATFDTLFSKYSGKLYAFGIKYLKSKPEAEELVQSVFMKIWENAGNLKVELSFKSFLFTIAYNEISNIYRKRKYQDDFIKESLSISGETSSETEESIDYKSLLDRIQEITARLPDKQRTAFKKSREEGKATREIAKEMGLSPGTVDNYISESLKYIRKMLGKDNMAIILFFYLFLN